MSDLFYRGVRLFGRVVFRVISARRILHPERARRKGAYLLAANHLCAYDAPLLIISTPRVIDWMSVVELFQNPLSSWFLTAFGALPLDRGKVDTVTVRKVARLLRAGRVVGMFPEGKIREGDESVLRSGQIDPGVCKLAQLTGAPVLPCVVLGGENFRRWTCWLPGARTRWTVAFGEAIFPRDEPDRNAAQLAMAEEITLALRALSQEAAAYV